MKLWLKIVIGLLLGMVVGISFRQIGLGPQVTEYLQPVGNIFLSLINMIIVLLVLSSMTVGITSIHDPEKLGRVGLKSLSLYLLTTLMAIALGICIATIFKPGSGADLKTTKKFERVEGPPVRISEELMKIIPSNPVAALVEGNMMQIIVFAIFLGVAINFSGGKGQPLRDVMESLADVMYRLTSIIMEFSPIGVFAIMASVAGSFGTDILVRLAKYLAIYYTGCVIHVLVVFCSLLWFLSKLNPWHFFLGMGDAIALAFSTGSSSATLPVSMHCVQENLGVSKNISSFVLPLGSTVNMNGAAMNQAMSVLFIAQAYGIELSLYQIVVVVVMATLGAIGAAGVPGSGFLMLSAVVTSAGLPAEGLMILYGIDRIREMGSTVLNILGDSVTAVCVAQQEGELDERQYYHEELVELEGSDV